MIKYVKRHFMAYLMVLPLVIGLAMFSIYPPIRGILMSFFDLQKITDPLKGTPNLNNYKELFKDPIFLQSIKTMFTLQTPRFVVNCTIPFIYGELIYLVKNKRLKSLYRLLILLPIVCPSIVYSLIWSNIYGYEGGLLNELLQKLHISSKNIDFLDRDHIIGALIFMGFPWLPGVSAIIVYSGLANIPSDVIEASRVDGCKTFRRIWIIDLPYLIGQIKYIVVFGIINIFQDYSNQLLFASRVGTKIHVPAYYMYQLVNTNQSIGKASAIGVILFIIIMLITIITYKFLNSKEDCNA